VALHEHPRLRTADDVGNDVAEAMTRCLLRLKLAAADHLLNKGVVVRQAMQFSAAQQITAAVPDMDNEQPRTEAVAHRDGSSHPG